MDINNNEIQLILLSTCKDLSSEKKIRLEKLLNDKDLDWDSFFYKIKKENVQSVVINNLIKHYSHFIPLDILFRLKKLLKELTVNNLSKLKELKNTLHVLIENGIPVIPWKGALLANDLHRSPTLRESVDMDILIQEKDLIKAKNALLAAGYQPIWKMNEAQEAFYIKNTHSYDMITPNRLILELHKSLARKYYMLNLPMDNFWKNSQDVQFLNLDVKYPQKEDLFLAIAIHHGGRDCWIKYKLLVDWYYLLLRYPDVDWDKILKSAETLGIRRVIGVGTLMCHRLFDLEIPKALEIYIKKKEKDLATKLLSGFFGSKELVKQSYLVIELREKLKHKILVTYKIFNSKSLGDIYFSTNPLLMFFYRPIRLFNKFILRKENVIEDNYFNR